MLVQAVDAEDCPVCLDPLLSESSVLLSCRHLVCKACTKALWQVAQGDAERRAKSLFECPVCRSEHCVAHADLDAFLAAHHASNFGAPEAGGPGATSRSSLRRSEEGLATFTVPELRIVVDELRLNVRDAIDRSDIERAAERQLERKVPLGTTAPRTLALLPERCLRRVLDTRAIPHDDCADKEALAIRVEQSPKGSCLGLPPRVLKRMLITFGLGDEVHIDKEELARRPGPPGSRVSPYPNGTHRDEEEQPCCKCSVM